MKQPHFGGISIFFAFLGFLGVQALVFSSGTPKRPKIPKNRVWGPVEAVSANFSGDLIVAHGDSATDEPKNPDFELLSRKVEKVEKLFFFQTCRISSRFRKNHFFRTSRPF